MAGSAADRPLGPEVHADRVVFRLEDRGYATVCLQQQLERPRNGPPLDRRNGVWELTYRRAQVDRMEYAFEADGESLCDPHNPRRAGDRSVVEFPGYRTPAWLTAPDPAPSVRIDARTRLWSPPDTDPLRPLPLLTVHDGTAYERQAELLRLIAHAIATARIPPCRIALRDAADRDEDYSASARYARMLTEPATAHVGLGASLGALALLHAHSLRPGTFAGLMLQSGSFFRRRWDGHEAGFPRFGRITRFVGSVLNAGPSPTPMPIALTCGAPEENLANNRAIAAALRRQGHAATLHVNRDAHNFVAWRDTLDPHLIDLLARAWG